MIPKGTYDLISAPSRNEARGSVRVRLASAFLIAFAVVVAGFAIANAGSADAHGSGITGQAKISISNGSPAGKKFSKAKIKFSPRVINLDVRSASGSGNNTVFKVKSKTVKVRYRKVVKKNGKKRTKAASTKLVITEVVAGQGKTWVTAKIGGKTVKKAFSLAGAEIRSNLGGTSVAITGPKLVIEKAAAKQLRKATKVKAAAKTKGKVLGDATFNVTAQNPLVPYPYTDDCNVQPISGGGESDWLDYAAQPAPLPEFEMPQAGSGGGTAITWGFIDSFRSYVINVMPPGSIVGKEGATIEGAPAAADAKINYPVTTGAFVAEGENPGRLVAKSEGTAIYCKAGHGFMFAFRNPTVVIDGENSRLVVDVAANIGGNWNDFQTVDIAELDISEAEVEYLGTGDRIRYSDIPATLTVEGADLLHAGLETYPVGTVMDTVTVTMNVDTPPFWGSCVMNSFTSPPVVTPPSINFTTIPDPEMESPVDGTGSFDWGVRRALRNSVSSGGASNPLGPFPLYGGVTESHPGNMGGGASPAPEGGIGKFFTFPADKATFEEADPITDSRLVLRSEGSLVFCNRTQGGYSVIISRPTLILNGEGSRIRANVYSIRNVEDTYHWVGGRVDLAWLSTTDATAEIDADGNVTFSDIQVAELTEQGAAAISIATGASTLDDPITVRFTPNGQ